MIPQLEAAGISFRPLVWTADGRPHPAATRTMKFAAQLVASKSGQEFGTGFLSRWKHEVQVAIQRRRAAMARSVLPRLSKEELWMIYGKVDAAPGVDQREPTLEQDDRIDLSEEPPGLAGG